MRKAKNALDELTKRFPPGEGQRHAITLGDDGHPLDITLFLGDVQHTISLDEYDLDCLAVEVVRQCVEIVEKNQHHYKELGK